MNFRGVVVDAGNIELPKGVVVADVHPPRGHGSH